MYPRYPQIKNNLLHMLEGKYHAKPDSSNFPANRVIGQMYVGGYVESKRDVPPEDRDVEQDKKDAEKRKKAKLKKYKKDHNIL